MEQTITNELNKSPPTKIKAQIRKCFYCGLPMRNLDVTRAECLSWLGIVPGQPSSTVVFRYMQETKEHLLQRALGGTDHASNIVLAHNYCNTTRGDRTPEQHKKWIKQLVADGDHPLAPMRDVTKRPSQE